MKVKGCIICRTLFTLNRPFTLSESVLLSSFSTSLKSAKSSYAVHTYTIRLSVFFFWYNETSIVSNYNDKCNQCIYLLIIICKTMENIPHLIYCCTLCRQVVTIWFEMHLLYSDFLVRICLSIYCIYFVFVL